MGGVEDINLLILLIVTTGPEHAVKRFIFLSNTIDTAHYKWGSPVVMAQKPMGPGGSTLLPPTKCHHHLRHISATPQGRLYRLFGRKTYSPPLTQTTGDVKCSSTKLTRKSRLHVPIRHVPIKSDAIRINERTVNVTTDPRHTP